MARVMVIIATTATAEYNPSSPTKCAYSSEHRKAFVSSAVRIGAAKSECVHHSNIHEDRWKVVQDGLAAFQDGLKKCQKTRDKRGKLGKRAIFATRRLKDGSWQYACWRGSKNEWYEASKITAPPKKQRFHPPLPVMLTQR